jgi:hypothetical protein
MGLAEGMSLLGKGLAGWSGEELVHDEEIITSNRSKHPKPFINGFGY